MTNPTAAERADQIRFMNFINHGSEWRQLKDIRRDIAEAIADAEAAARAEERERAATIAAKSGFKSGLMIAELIRARTPAPATEADA